ncbi:MAG: NUDIX domain-containing protein [Chlamydiota bacterium]
MERHFTASVYILKGEYTLLIFHPKFKKWLPPGGHVEPNESPAETARREVREETGLEIEWIRDERIWISTPNAESFERPFACLAEDVPTHASTPHHQHLDFIYLAKPVGQITGAHPEHPMQWFSLAEVETLASNDAVFPDTKQMLTVILTLPLLKV